MKTEKEFTVAFKEKNPIVETSGSGTGTYKWQRYLDGIDMRFGYLTRKSAEIARAKSAKEAYLSYQYTEAEISCPKCGKKTTQDIIDRMGKCWDCEKKDPAYDHMAGVR